MKSSQTLTRDIVVAKICNCAISKHAGSGRARKKCRGNHEAKWSVSSYFLSALPFPKCFATEQSTIEAFLFCSIIKKRTNYFPQEFGLIFKPKFIIQTGKKVASACICSLIKYAKISQTRSLLELFN